jgi:hypothetical protein
MADRASKAESLKAQRGLRYPEYAGPSAKSVANAKKVLAEQAAAERRREAGVEVQCAAFGASPSSPIAEPCGEWFPIAEAVLIDEKRWVPPYGCTGGAYWTSGEAQFVCPKCGYLNRAYGRDAIEDLRPHFARRLVAYKSDNCFDRRLSFEGDQTYPFPAHVQAQRELEAAEAEARRAQAKADRLRGRAA